MAAEPIQIESSMWADLSKVPMEDKSTMYDQYTRIPLNGNLAGIKEAPRYTFQNSDKANWYDYSRSYLFAVGKITQSNGNALAAGTSAAVVNSGWNLFRKPTATYGGQPLHVPEKDHCGHIANIQSLAEFSEDYARSGASSSGFYPDTADGSTGITGLSFTTAADPAVTGANVGALMTQIAAKIVYNPEAYNQGYAQRSALANQSALQSFILPLRDVFGFFKHNQFAMRGELFEFTIDRETSDARMIHATADAPAGLKWEFTNIELWVPQVRPSVIEGAKLDMQIASGFVTRVPFKDTRAYVFDNGTKTSVQWNPANLKNPEKLIFAMYDTTADTNQTVNAGIYKPFGLTKLITRLNGTQYPNLALEPDFAAKSYARSYHNFLELYGKSDPTKGLDHGSIINYKRFGEIYAFHGIDLSHRNNSVDDSTVLYRLDIEATVDATPKKIVVLVETDEELKLVGSGTGVKIVP